MHEACEAPASCHTCVCDTEPAATQLRPWKGLQACASDGWERACGLLDELGIPGSSPDPNTHPLQLLLHHRRQARAATALESLLLLQARCRAFTFVFTHHNDRRDEGERAPDYCDMCAKDSKTLSCVLPAMPGSAQWR